MPKQNISATNGGGGPIRINTNPNPKPAPGVRNPTKAIIDQHEMNEPVYEKYGYPKSKTISINSSNHQPRIGGHAN